MNELPFIKMHGLGNDFVVIDGREHDLSLTAPLVRWIGDRHRGVGFDQLAWVERDDEFDAKITFFNGDGSQSGACGNATRCLGAWLSAETGRSEITLRSVAGVLRTTTLAGGRIEAAMTEPKWNWDEIPVAEACDTLAMPVQIANLPPPVGVNMGNPHAVFFVRDVNEIEVLGSRIETHPFFPERVNAGFAWIKDRATMRLRVHERGAGLTLACGSGACAAHVAAFRRGLVDGRTRIEVDGGEMEIAWSGDGPVVMTGPAAISFYGKIDLDSISP